jgi:YD repeat-containing protein
MDCCCCHNRYDSDRRVAARAIAGVGETTFGYDFSHINDRHQYSVVTTDALGNKTTEVYTANSQLLSRTSPMGRVTTYERKSNGGVNAKFINGRPASATIRDENGYVVTRIDAKGLKTHYTYDDFGNQTSMRMLSIDGSLIAGAIDLTYSEGMFYLNDPAVDRANLSGELWSSIRIFPISDTLILYTGCVQMPTASSLTILPGAFINCMPQALSSAFSIRLCKS